MVCPGVDITSVAAQIAGRHVVLLSGGWDSAYCAVVARKRHGASCILCLFFHYGQPYLALERCASAAVARALRLELRSIQVPGLPMDERGVFDNRNEMFIAMVAPSRPASIYFGCRNPFAALDAYKDSNWQWARRMQSRHGVTIHTPCVLVPKWWLRRAAAAHGVQPQAIYSTEAPWL